MATLRQMVLQSFKILHRTRLKVFSGDERALAAARAKINEDFAKNKHVSNEDSIKEMVKFANNVAEELRTQIIQAKEIKPGVYKAKLTDDTVKLQNIPYNDDAVPEDNQPRKNPCCQSRT